MCFLLQTRTLPPSTHLPRSLSLRPYDLSPSYANVFNKFSVRYFINLVLVDEEDRRYFKQQVRQAGRQWCMCCGAAVV